MKSQQAYRIENKFRVKAIEGGEDGLVYFVDGSGKIVIAGEKGMTLLNAKQAKTLADEFGDILSMRRSFS